jgi:hypothetical protein
MYNVIFNQEDYPVKIYDMSIEDVDERNKKALKFKKASAAATFLGIPPKNIYCKIGPGKYAHQPDGKKWAVRKVS